MLALIIITDFIWFVTPYGLGEKAELSLLSLLFSAMKNSGTNSQI